MLSVLLGLGCVALGFSAGGAFVLYRARKWRSLDSAQRNVEAFHRASGQPIATSPCIPDAATVDLRVRLMTEELGEICEALADGDVVELADGLADLAYVLLGTAVVSGIPIAEIFDEVDRTNMEKFALGCVNDEHGKVVKPPGWKPPDIAPILRAHGWDPENDDCPHDLAT